ncbi:MAG: ASCH domain-containing protein [Patescibacteria group bacterium]
MFPKHHLKINVKEPYFSYLKEGKKTIEGRLAKEKFVSLNPGDVVLINDLAVFEVEGVVKYNSFREMLASEGLNKVIPDANSIQEGVSVYYNFYTEHDEKMFGVVAIKLLYIRDKDG